MVSYCKSVKSHIIHFLRIPPTWCSLSGHSSELAATLKIILGSLKRRWALVFKTSRNIANGWDLEPTASIKCEVHRAKPIHHKYWYDDIQEHILGARNHPKVWKSMPETWKITFGNSKNVFPTFFEKYFRLWFFSDFCHVFAILATLTASWSPSGEWKAQPG